MRELEFLARSIDLPNLTVYRYGTRPLRIAVMNHIARVANSRGLSLTCCSTDDFVTRALGSGFFAADDEVLFLDWEAWSDRELSPVRVEAEDELDEEVSQVTLFPFLEIARDRPDDAVPVVILVRADDARLDGWAPKSGQLIIDAATSVPLDEIDLLVDAITGKTTISAERRANIVSSARQLWRQGAEFALLCDEIESLVLSLPGVDHVRKFEAEPGWKPRNVGYGVKQLQALLQGAPGARDRFLRHFQRPHRRPSELLEAVAKLTARLLEKHRFGALMADQASVRSAYDALMWLAIVIGHWRPLSRVGGNTGRIWPLPDRSASVLVHILEDAHSFLAARRIDDAAKAHVASGAQLSRSTFPGICDRYISVLRDMVQFFGATTGPGAATVGEFASFLLLHLDQKDETSCGPAQPVRPVPQLQSLDELIGRQAAKFVFLQRLDARHHDPRAFRRPLLLIGPDGVGKRLIGDLFARLFACSVASANSPRVCGKCEGCLSLEHRILVADVAQLEASADRSILRDRVRNRGTVAGSAVTIVHGIDRLSIPETQTILKSVEEEAGVGLKIFTARESQSVSDALWSRCYVVHVWPLRREEAMRFATDFLTTRKIELDSDALFEIVGLSHGNVAGLIDRLDHLVAARMSGRAAALGDVQSQVLG